MFENKITFDKLIRGLIIIAIITSIIFLLNYLSKVLLPFFVAWFIAYLIFPIVKFFQDKLHFHYRFISIIATLVFIIGIVVGLWLIIMPSVIEQANHFWTLISKLVAKETNGTPITTLIGNILIENNINIENLISQKDTIELAKTIGLRLWYFVYGTINIVISIISSCIAILYLFFILMDYEHLYASFIKMFTKSKRNFVIELCKDLEKGMNSYFRGQGLIALCVGVLYSIGFTIIDLPLAIPIGVLIGILSLVPYLHALGLAPAILMTGLKAAETGQNFWIGLVIVLSVFVIIQIIQDTILTPIIMGKAVSLPAYLILLSLSIWGYILGIIGMIIALPLTTVMISYYRRYIIKDK